MLELLQSVLTCGCDKHTCCSHMAFLCTLEHTRMPLRFTSLSSYVHLSERHLASCTFCWHSCPDPSAGPAPRAASRHISMGWGLHNCYFMTHRKAQSFQHNRTKQTVCVTCHVPHPLDMFNFPHSSAKTVRCALAGSVAASGSYSYSIPASLSRFCRWLSRRSARSCRAACNLLDASGCAHALERSEQRRIRSWLSRRSGCACSGDSTSSGHQHLSL